MAARPRRGEDGISFEHCGPCRDPERHRHCPGLWRGEFTLGYTGDGHRTRRKVSGKTKAAVASITGWPGAPTLTRAATGMSREMSGVRAISSPHRAAGICAPSLVMHRRRVDSCRGATKLAAGCAGRGAAYGLRHSCLAGTSCGVTGMVRGIAQSGDLAAARWTVSMAADKVANSARSGQTGGPG